MKNAAIRLNQEISKGTSNITPEVIFAILIPFERKPSEIYILDRYYYKEKYNQFFRDSILNLSLKDKSYGLYLLGEQPILNMDTNAYINANTILSKLTSAALGGVNNVLKKSISKTSMFYTTLTRKYLKIYFS